VAELRRLRFKQKRKYTEGRVDWGTLPASRPGEREAAARRRAALVIVIDRKVAGLSHRGFLSGRKPCPLVARKSRIAARLSRLVNRVMTN
jgi:hypothetical protein